MKNQSLKEMYKPSEVFIKRNKELAEKILKVDLSDKTDEQLKNMSLELKSKLKNEKNHEKYICDAFSLAVEASARSIGLRHFDTQVLAGLALFQNRITELPTGEGKTLAAVLPAFLRVCMGHKVHILTFNDYLAGRDLKWMSPIFDFLGIKASVITQKTPKNERKSAYKSDVLYATARELGFDHLRDFLENDKDFLNLNPFDTAIVDEADSIMIDEARIPLVIAGDVPYSSNIYITVDKAAASLKNRVDFEMDSINNTVSLTPHGAVRAEELLGIEDIYNERNFSHLEAVHDAVKARYMLKRDIDYIVRDGKIELVDEFTGRVADKRHYPEGLHAAVETKEGIKTQSQGMILSSINLRHFLKLYDNLSGMTGTAMVSADEFWESYSLSCVDIPPHIDCVRKDRPHAIYKNQNDKFAAAADEIKKEHERGRPVLIGTRTIRDSEYLAGILEKRGIACSVLNAKNDEQEAEIIAGAGMFGAVTVSTNMAGRGVDIKLGGEQGVRSDEIEVLGGLYVIGTNLHDSIRIDNQLRGRAGRQGDSGESRFFISLQDDLMQRFSISGLLPEGYLQRLPQSGIIEDKRVVSEANRIQRIAQGQSFDLREQQSKYDDLIEDQRRIMYKKRCRILLGDEFNSTVRDRDPDFYYDICKKVGNEGAQLAEKQLVLYFINRCWAEYLDYISYIKQGVHFVVIGGKNPLTEFQRAAIDGFEEMQEEIKERVLEEFCRLPITEKGIDMDAAGLGAPSATWVYLVNESSSQFSRLPHIIRSVRNESIRMVKSGKTLFEKILAFLGYKGE